MIATISKTFTFDAAHRLDRLPPEHKCHRMHGHTYRVELILSGHVADNGFLLDYADIAEMWAPLHELLDHRILNEVPG
ncbi:MAG TPA: 6-carboxytetrahydropterin synthase, partial [Haliangium sp.]|nr:6-carboxytetrahydropterin synthase [Haliangium sp.]